MEPRALDNFKVAFAILMLIGIGFLIYTLGSINEKLDRFDKTVPVLSVR